MTQKTKTTPTAITAIAFSIGVIGLATALLYDSKLSEFSFIFCIVLSALLGICIYRSRDITDLAFSKGASVKLARAEEISDGVSELAKQILALFEPTPVDDGLDEEAHEKEMAAILQKIKSLTKRAGGNAD